MVSRDLRLPGKIPLECDIVSCYLINKKNMAFLQRLMNKPDMVVFTEIVSSELFWPIDLRKVPFGHSRSFDKFFLGPELFFTNFPFLKFTVGLNSDT